MSDQVHEDPDQADSSYEADVEAAQGSGDDRDAGLAGSGLGNDGRTETSHEADIEAGYDETAAGGADAGSAEQSSER